MVGPIIAFIVGCAVTVVGLGRWSRRRIYADAKKFLYIGLAGVVVLIVGIVGIVSGMGQSISEVKPVIVEFMEAGAANNTEAAYACWSPRSVTEEEIAEYIESYYDLVFAGYERLSINSWNIQSSGSVTTCYGSGAVIYTGDQSLPLETSLQKESGVWKITGIYIGSTVKGIVTRPPPSDDDWDYWGW
jgi:hypothetical protein